MARIYEGRPAGLNRIGARFEDLLYRLCGVDPAKDMRWTEYALAMLLFNLLGAVAVYGLQRLQAYLPLNPAGTRCGHPGFVFQYGGELRHQHQLARLRGRDDHELSHPDARAHRAELPLRRDRYGIVVALIRGFVRRSADGIGNFWVDMTRSTLYILLPLSLILAVVLVSQGVVQTFDAYKTVPLLEPVTYEQPTLDAEGTPLTDTSGNPLTETITAKEQVIAVGPAASQIAIKQLGTNGGGFFNVNSAHPLENATPFSNFLEMLAILLIPAALCYTFGKMVGDTRQGWAILAAMTILFVGLLLPAEYAEWKGNPAFAALGVDQTANNARPVATWKARRRASASSTRRSGPPPPPRPRTAQ